MSKSLLLVSILAIPSWSAPSLERQRGVFVSPDQQEALRQIIASAQWTSINMRVSAGGGNFIEVNEPFLRVQMSGHKSGGGYYNLSGYADREYLNITARPRYGQDPSKGFDLWGSGVSVDVHPQGRDGWRLWGNAGSYNLSMQITRSGNGYYSIWGQGGTSLSASAFGNSINVNGSVDLAQFGPKSLTILGFALAVIHDAATPPREPEAPAPSSKSSR